MEHLFNYYRDIEVLPVNYNDAIANPKLIATQVNEFLGGKWDANAMISAIDPSLRHQKC